MFNRTLDTLLVHHVSLGVIWIVTKRPPELLGLNQKHVRGCTSIVPRVPDAAVPILLELVVVKLKKPYEPVLTRGLKSLSTLATDIFIAKSGD